MKRPALWLIGATVFAGGVFACGGLLGLPDRTSGPEPVSGEDDNGDASGEASGGPIRTDAASDAAAGDANSADASDTWEMLAPMASPRSLLAAGAVDGKGYVAGGVFSGSSTSHLLEAYEPLQDAWTLGPPNQESLWAVSTAVVDHTIYFFGGMMPTVTAEVRAYDASGQRWSTASALPAPRAFTSAAVIAGKAYVFGGETAPGAADNTVSAESFVFDPGAGAWSAVPAMPTARSRASSATASGVAYVIGGTAASPSPVATLEKYDPGANQWSTGAPMPTPRYDATCAAVNGILYVIGGRTSSSAGVSTVEAYDPATDQWTHKADMPTPRGELTSFVIGGRIFVAGGRYGITDLASLEAYTP